MNDDSLGRPELDIDAQRTIDAHCDEFENALRSGTQPRLEEFLQRVDPRYRGPLLRELLPLELDSRADDRSATLATYLRRFPEYEDVIREVFAERHPAVSIDRLLDAITRAGLIEAQVTQRLLNEVDPETAGNTVRFANLLVEAELLTEYQRDVLVAEKTDPVVLGDYIILDRLGRGGMGQVYKARHRRMERVVALKTLPDELAADAEALSRFHREVKAVARLSHPNIVTAHDAREDNGVHYLVMEYVPGDDLSKHVKERGPMPPQAAAESILQAARGLEYAHRQGVIHRDVKPSNLLLQNRRGAADSGSVVKVLDLGLARIEHPDGDPNRSQTELTGSGAVMGTVDYMAPEQAQNTHNADQRSDIYSLGMTFYYLLTGQTAYGGSTVMERLLAHREQPIPSLESSLQALHAVSGAEAESSVGQWKGLDDMFRKMAAKKPADRYQTMSQVIAELEPFAKTMRSDPPAVRSSLGTSSVGESGRRSSFTSVGSAASDLGPVTAATIKPPSPSATADDTLRDLARERTVKVPPRAVPTVPPFRISTGKWVAAAMLLVGIVAAGIVYRIQTDHGTIVVDIEDDSIAALLTASGLEIFDRNDPDKKWTINLAPVGEAVTEGIPSGDYEIPAIPIPGVELHINDGEGAEYTGSEFKLTRGDEVRIRVTAEWLVPGDPDRSAALFVLSMDGQVAVNDDPTPLRSADQLPEGELRLQMIRLSENPDVTDATLAIFRDCRHMERLSLHGSPIGDAGLACFANSRQWKSVVISGTQVTDAGLAQLQGVEGLKVLNIDNTQITDAGLAHFADCQELTKLSVARTAVTDAGLADFHDCEQLTELAVHLTQVSAEGVDSLHLALPNCTITSDFGTFGPALVDYANEREVAEWVLSVGGIVWVSGPNVDEQSFRELPLPEQPFHLMKIILRGDSTVTDADLTRLESLKHLVHLNLNTCEGITDAGAESIASMTTLQEVFLQGTSVTDVGLAHIVRLPGLRWIQLDFTRVTEPGVKLLAGADQLEELSLCSLPVSIEALRALRTLPLKRLSLSSTQVRYADLPEIVTLFPLLEAFDGRRLQGEEGAGLSPLAELSHLEELVVDSSDVTAGAPHQLERFNRLRKLYLYYSEFPTGLATELQLLPGVTELYLISPYFKESAFGELSGNTTLVRLEIEEWPGSDDEIMQLTGMANLRRLRIRGSNWTDAGAQAFHEQRPDVAIYGDFNISADAVADQPDYAQEREVAEWVLSIGGTVTVVDSDEAEFVISALPLPDQSFQIVRIDLEANAGFSDGDLARLQSLSALRVINLNECRQIGDEGVSTLARIPTLEEVSIQYSAVTDAGLAQLALLPSLRSLALSVTAVTDAGLMHLAGCSHLQSLGLREVPISIEGLRALRDVPLKSLIINETQVHWSDLPEIAAIFPELRRFDGFKLQGDMGDGLSPLAQLRDLEILVLTAEFITAGPPHLIEQFPQLRKLEMHYTSVPTGLAARLEQLPRVKELYLERATFDNGAFAELCTNSTLERLELHVWSGGDAELLQLSAMPKLRRLVLQQTQVTAAGAQAFHEARPDVAITGEFNIPAEAVANQPDYAQEREVAEWVLERGGTLMLRNGVPSVNSLEELPDEPIQVAIVRLSEIADLQNTELTRLQLVSSLSVLDLHRTPLSDDVLNTVANLRSLQSLDLNSCQNIDGTGLPELTALPRLESIYLHGTSIADEALAVVPSFPALQKITVSDTGVTAEGLAHIVACPTLTKLAVSHTSITAEDLQLLLDRPERWVELHLDGSQVTPASTQVLAQLTSLRQLSVNGACDLALLQPLTAVTELTLWHDYGPDDVEALASLAHLEILRIGFAEMTQENIETLHEALPNCTIISDFGTFGPVTVNYAQERDVAEWVLERGGSVGLDGTNTLLTSIDELPAEGFQVTRVIFDHIADLRGDELVRLQELTALSDLGIQWSPITDADLAHIAQLPRLRFLHVTGCSGIDGSGLEQLVVLPDLIQIGLDSTSVTDDALAALPAFPALHRVYVAHTAVSGNGLAHIVECSKLDSLRINESSITADDLRHLMKRPDRLRVLAIGASQVAPASVEVLARLTSLQMFSVDGVCDLELLSQLTNLTALSLRGDYGTDHVSLLESFTGLTTLDIQGTQLTERQVKVVHYALPHSTITSDFGTFEPIQVDFAKEREVAEWVLSLGGTLVVGQDIVGSYEDGMVGVETNDQLPADDFWIVTINLNDNDQVTNADMARVGGLSRIGRVRLIQTGISDAGIRLLVNAESLQFVQVDRNNLTDAGVELLSQLPCLTDIGLSENRGLTRACLEDLRHMIGLTGIGIGGTQIRLSDLAELPMADTLTGCSLQYSRDLMDDDLVHLARFPKLKVVNLNHTGVTDAGLVALQAIPNLQTLYLTNNERITDAAVPALSELAGLTELHTAMTRMTQQGVEALQEALPECKIVSDYGTFEPQ